LRGHLCVQLRHLADPEVQSLPAQALLAPVLPVPRPALPRAPELLRAPRHLVPA
jgi:hypothetical protein